MVDIKKKTVTGERNKELGRFVPKGTDKLDPKGTSISKLDRPDHYKKREPKPSPEVVPTEDAPVEQSREFDADNVVTNEQAILNNAPPAPVFPSEHIAKRNDLPAAEGK